MGLWDNDSNAQKLDITLKGDNLIRQLPLVGTVKTSNYMVVKIGV